MSRAHLQSTWLPFLFLVWAVSPCLACAGELREEFDDANVPIKASAAAVSGLASFAAAADAEKTAPAAMGDPEIERLQARIPQSEELRDFSRSTARELKAQLEAYQRDPEKAHQAYIAGIEQEQASVEGRLREYARWKPSHLREIISGIAEDEKPIVKLFVDAGITPVAAVEFLRTSDSFEQIAVLGRLKSKESLTLEEARRAVSRDLSGEYMMSLKNLGNEEKNALKDARGRFLGRKVGNFDLADLQKRKARAALDLNEARAGRAAETRLRQLWLRATSEAENAGALENEVLSLRARLSDAEKTLVRKRWRFGAGTTGAVVGAAISLELMREVFAAIHGRLSSDEGEMRSAVAGSRAASRGKLEAEELRTEHENNCAPFPKLGPCDSDVR